MIKKWNMCCDGIDQGLVEDISDKLGVLPLTAQLLAARGNDSVEKAESFITLEENRFYNPYLMPDMDKAVERILAAVDKKEKVAIYGDYDVDGVTSVSILYMYLERLGLSPLYYIPDRAGEGYGVNNDAIDMFHEKNIALMITVDTGVTAIDEVEYAKTLGIDTVVTDHHECQSQLPDAVAVVNPRREDSKYPFAELAGVGVVFKLICAIEKRICERAGREDGNIKEICDRYIDLTAVGTVADVMPLRDENRLIVALGIDVMQKHPRLGLTALREAAADVGGKDKTQLRPVSSSVISFTIAPRINAAGRMASANKAVDLFLCSSPAEAKNTAEQLCEINRMRQEEENSIIESALEKIQSEFDFENDTVIVLAQENWHHGVIGIVSSRITERYGLPSILISFDENDIGKGSGRSVKGINLVDALTYCSDLLVKYGGHELAAGLTLERKNYDEFVRRINEYAKQRAENIDLTPVLDIDAEVVPEMITMEQAEDLSRLEPYGIANPMPTFALRSAVISDITSLTGKHTRFTLRCGDNIYTALWFSRARTSIDFYVGDVVDVAFQMSINDFRGRKSVQLIVKDMMLSNPDEEISDADKAEFTRIMNGGAFRRDDGYMPARDDFAKVYLYLKRRCDQVRDDRMGVREIIKAFCGKLGYVKVKLILEILADGGLITMEKAPQCDDNIHITINFVRSKTDLEKIPTCVRLKMQMEKA